MLQQIFLIGQLASDTEGVRALCADIPHDGFPDKVLRWRGVLAFAAFERAVVVLNIHSGFQTGTMPQSDYTSWS